MRKKPEYIRELFAKADERKMKSDKVKAVVKHMVKQDEFIDSVKTVARRIEEEYGPDDITETDIRKVMKQMNMRYRKVNHIAMSANSQRSMILR